MAKNLMVMLYILLLREILSIGKVILPTEIYLLNIKLMLDLLSKIIADGPPFAHGYQNILDKKILEALSLEQNWM